MHGSMPVPVYSSRGGTKPLHGRLRGAVHMRLSAEKMLMYRRRMGSRRHGKYYATCSIKNLLSLQQ